MKGIITLQVNKIYNEDCLVGLKKIPDNSVDLVIIDPPYDICTKGGKKGSGRLCYDLTKLENELKANNLVNGYDLSILDELIRVMKEIALDKPKKTINGITFQLCSFKIIEPLLHLFPYL